MSAAYEDTQHYRECEFWIRVWQAPCAVLMVLILSIATNEALDRVLSHSEVNVRMTHPTTGVVTDSRRPVPQ